MDLLATSHFSDNALLHDAKHWVAQDSTTTAVLLSRIAEIDDRKLYLREGYPSLFAFCVHELRLSEDATYRRITAARAARRFPSIFVALAEGRVHLTAVLMLGLHLTSANAEELLVAATHKTRPELELLLAERFPRRDLPERLEGIPAPSVPSPRSAPPTPGRVGQLAPERVQAIIPDQNAHGHVEAPAPAPTHPPVPQHAESPAAREKMIPLAPQRFGLQVTLDQEAHDLLQQARALMGHQVPTGEIAPVIKRALQLLVAHLKQRKFAATTRPGRSRRAASARHIPAAVKRAVWERDGGRCTFVSEGGRRCPEGTRLEYDHRQPVARGRGDGGESAPRVPGA